MMSRFSNLSSRLILAAALCLAAGNVNARTLLLHPNTPISHNPENGDFEDGDNSMKNIIDGDINTDWHSAQGEALHSDAFITVKLDSPLTLGKEESLIFTTVRCTQHDNMAPIHFLLEGSADGVNFDKICNIFYLYRGKGTREFSHRVRFTQTYQYFRLTVKANNSRTTHDGSDHGHRLMGLAELQIIRLNDSEMPGYGFKDNLHLVTDYDYHYRNYGYEYTDGFLNPANRKYSVRADKWCEWDNWKDGKWTKDRDFLEANGIAMPDYTMVTNADTESPVNRVLKAGEKRQPAYTTEHILYAVPGDLITLYPFYEFPREARPSFLINYSHWYDWTTGGHIVVKNYDDTYSNALDLAIDPSGIIYSDKNGYFGGPGFWKYKTGGVITISSVGDWLDFVDRVNKGSTTLNARIMADLDFTGYDDVDPVGKTQDKAYCGKIDGQGHTIKGLVMSSTSANFGFIGYARDGMELRNINFDSKCIIEAPQSVGIIGNLQTTTTEIKNENQEVIKTVIGEIVISNITSQATITCSESSGSNVGGVVGYGKSYGKLTIENSIIGGLVTKNMSNPSSKLNAALIGWIDYTGTNSVIFRNIIVTAQVPFYESESKYYWRAASSSNIVKENCWGPITSDQWGFASIPNRNLDINTTTFADKFGGNFEIKDGKLTPVVYTDMDLGEVTILTKPDQDHINDYSDSYYGTVGTFFIPRKPEITGSETQYTREIENLPMPSEERSEYVVAADFSCSFVTDSNLTTDESGKDKIIEPILHFRHLFRIRDGVKFADDFSKDLASNRDYHRKNRIAVSARRNAAFQVRLPSAVPVETYTTTPSNFYYKTSDGEYRRVCTMGIHVYEAITGKDVTSEVLYDKDKNPKGIKFANDFEGQGSRWIGGKKYSLCGGGGRYYRMLSWENPATVTVTTTNKNGETETLTSSKFIVRITGNDINGHPITFPAPAGTTDMEKDANLVAIEYELDFESEKDASFLLENELYGQEKWKEIRPENIEARLNTVLGDKVDFDEYRALEHKFIAQGGEAVSGVESNSNYLMQDGDKFWVKWPRPWHDTNYSFAYDYAYNTERKFRYDYNQYLIASHCNVTPWHGAAGRFGIEDKDVKTGEKGNEDDDNYGMPAGLYDRRFYNTRRHGLTDPSVKPERGYFYYINAATDPGVMARLKIKDLCLGSKVHVSAWIAEFSKALVKINDVVQPHTPGETANLVFHFVAVLGDEAGDRKGERVKLHSFVSGYVPWGDNDKDFTYVGHWMHLYYSFVPNFADFSLSKTDIDHFELELDNNCVSSNGADYAIDDIAMYIENPTVEAKQMSKLCDDATKEITVKVEADYEVLLKSLNLSEGTLAENQDVKVYYTFIDKEKFDAVYDPDVADSGLRAYQGDGTEANPGAVVRYPYDGGEEVKTYGTLKFNTCFINNDEYDYKTDAEYINVARRETDDEGTRKIVFNTVPTDYYLHAEKKYYIALALHQDTKDENGNVAEYHPDWYTFNITELCTLQCQFKVQGASVTKLDGKITERDDELGFCEGQTPVVQVNLAGINPSTGEVEIVEKNAFFDWYNGTYDEYVAENDSVSGMLLSDAIDKLRQVYPLADDMLLVKVDELTEAEGLTQEIVDYLTAMTTTIRNGESEPRLRLHQRSFVFPPLHIPDNRKETTCSVLAVPITWYYISEDDPSNGTERNLLICSEPTIVTIKVDQKSPSLRHGLEKGITYPEYLTDVPLRVSLAQIKQTAVPEKADRAEYMAHPYQLNIPVRKVTPTGLTKEKEMRIVFHERENDEDGGLLRQEYYSDEVSLVYTDDPEYKDLGSPDYTGEEIHLLHIGRVAALTAIEGQPGNEVNVVFYDSFNFKEGYTYRLRFPFEEKGEGGNANCPGQDIFTIKIVPEYQKFTGAQNRNYNNDNNWSRVEADEIYAAAGTAARGEAFVSDANPNTKSFAPLDYTKIIIPGGETSLIPNLYKIDEADLSAYFTKTGKTVLWPASLYNKDMPATIDIQYDMVGFGRTDLQGIYCRPWYAYTCQQVHFLPQSEILGQERLRYDRAWVDLQINASRWYTLSMPLQEVYAGDMYLPTQGARQRTEMFQPITFNTAQYDRFRPAVYQRGWDKSETVVYELGDPAAHNVAVKAAWSNVYNDVEVKYGAGTGFSIKADNTQATNPGTDVIFRLPKADIYYEYYDKATGAKGHYTSIPRDTVAHYRLNPVESTMTAIAAPGSKFFLVGNPFMAKMNLAEFFDMNSDKILPKYWLISEEGQQFGVFDASDGSFKGTASDIVAPMQGFFVEAIAPGLTADGKNALLELEYTKDMIYEADDSSVGLKVRKYGTDASSVGLKTLSITATPQHDAPSSTAILQIDEDAQEGFVPSRDVQLLDNSAMLDAPMAYVIAGNMASSLATKREVENTQIGVVAPAEQRVTLTFDGVDDLGDEYYLYNASTGEMAPLSEDAEYRVTAPISGLFITRGEIPAGECGITYSVEGRLLTVNIGSGEPTDIAICDFAGCRIASLSAVKDRATITLPSGIYILRAENTRDTLTAKILIRDRI